MENRKYETGILTALIVGLIIAVILEIMPILLVLPLILLLSFYQEVTSSDPRLPIYRYRFSMESNAFEDLEKLFSGIREEMSLFDKLKSNDKILIFHSFGDPNDFILFTNFRENGDFIVKCLSNHAEKEIKPIIEKKNKIFYFKESFMFNHINSYWRVKNCRMIRIEKKLNIIKKDFEKLEEWIKKEVNWKIKIRNNEFVIKPNKDTPKGRYLLILDAEQKKIIYNCIAFRDHVLTSEEFCKLYDDWEKWIRGLGNLLGERRLNSRVPKSENTLLWKEIDILHSKKDKGTKDKEYLEISIH